MLRIATKQRRLFFFFHILQRLFPAIAAVSAGCGQRSPETAQGPAPAAALDPAGYWNSATIYFLLTDRFANGDTTNDRALGRARDADLLRGYEGGDLAGLLRIIESGYFDSLGVDAIWLTPFVEQVAGGVDEGYGKSYAFHGYWTKDWTAVDPSLGSFADLRAVVDAAHRHGIRVLMDAVINHTGPVTPQDPAWPSDWVRTSPNCTYRSYTTTADCTLVRTLPDILTDRDQPVELPPMLVEKWRREGRLEREQAELDAFFRRTGYPRAPRYYVIKWLTDWVRELGFDGYRMDTAKHFGESVSAELKREADAAFAEWKRANPLKALDGLPFYMVGEVYGWGLGSGREYSFGDRSVDYFNFGYQALINFSFKRDAAGSLDSLFTRYAASLRTGPLRGVSLLNYVSSHDDGEPFDMDRRDPLGAGTRLLLAPGGAQIYYGDETARPLRIAGTRGDATLRGMMNWPELRAGGRTAEVLRHWRRLGTFRRAHPAVGAGEHRMLQAEPYVFSRTLDTAGRTDRVVVAIGLTEGPKTIPVTGVFAEGLELEDSYTGTTGRVRNGAVSLTTPFGMVLLAEPVRTAESARPFEEPVQLHVVNNSQYQMEIFAAGGGATHRLGTVAAGTRGSFTVRQAMVASARSMEFLAQATGQGPRVNSGSLFVTPGSIVDFEIGALLNPTTSVRRQ